ncbi:MAG: hypothetical protein H8E66_16140 [Planctomycetes bacterium]|nr:hypothetical protein [Planctomycetota bacterium]
MSTCTHCGEEFEGGSSGEKPVCLNCRSSFAFPPPKPVPAPELAAPPDADFDPYHTWLGIPPPKQPPNHYQLLGLTQFEVNLEVIAAAANRQSNHLRSYLDSPHVRDAKRLLAEIDAARVCLLNEYTKSAYDQALGRSAQPHVLSPASKDSASKDSACEDSAGAAPKSREFGAGVASANRTPADAPALTAFSQAEDNETAHAPASQDSSPIPVRRRKAKPKRSPFRQVVQMVVGGIAGCAIGYYLGFVLIPSLRARSTKSPPPPPQLVIRQSPKRSSDQSQYRRRVAAQNQQPPAQAPPPQSPPIQARPTQQPPTQASLPTRTSSTTPRVPTSANSPAPTAPPRQPQRASANKTSPPPSSTSTARSPRMLSDLVPTRVATAPVSLVPLGVQLPKRSSSLAQSLFPIPNEIELKSPRLLTDAAALQEGEYLYLEEIEDAGVRAWTVSAAIPGAAGDGSPREIGEFGERDGEMSFRWFSDATAVDEALLLNSMLKLADDQQQPPIALREAIKASPIELDMNERRTTHSFGVGALPRKELLTLELGSVSEFPSRARIDKNARELAIGRNAVIVFDEIPGAEVEVKFQGVTDQGLTIALTPRFRENSASVVPMTKSQLDTTLRSVEKTIVRTQSDIRNGQASLSRLRSQSTSRLSGAEAAGLAGLINKTQSRVNSDERRLTTLQARLANGPRIRTLLDALHHRPTLEFRITAPASSREKITLVDGGLRP